MCVCQNVEALQKAEAEIQKLHLERERYEDSMKKAFMRGVCALNMEALSMFHGGEGRPQEHGESHDLLGRGWGGGCRKQAGCPASRVMQGIPISHILSGTLPTPHRVLNPPSPQP